MGAAPTYRARRISQPGWPIDRGSEGVAQDLESLGDQAVVDPEPSLLPRQQARLVEHLQMVADGWLGEPQGFDHVADAGLAVWLAGQASSAAAAGRDRR